MKDSVLEQAYIEALSNCASEPIRTPGKIQPHGVLIVVESTSFQVTQASANASAFLGRPAEQLVDSNLADALGSPFCVQLRTLEKTQDLVRPARLRVELERIGTSWSCEARVHRQGSSLILELEDDDRLDPTSTLQLTDWIHRFLKNLPGSMSMTKLCQAIAEEARVFSGYDRVMVYRFHPDLHGEVIAESVKDGLDPFLGLHYPASDIPSQARELYLQNRIRVLVDDRADPVPILNGVGATSQPLDITFCQLRAFSPVHLEYLGNMGVRASLVTSIILGERLWGLMVFHHRSTRKPTHGVRATCELLSELLSLEVASQEKLQQLRGQHGVANLLKRIVQSYLEDADWKDVILSTPEIIQSPILATSLALIDGSTIRTLGSVPETETIREISTWIVANRPGPIFSTDSLGDLNPRFEGISRTAGVLLVEIARASPTHLIWFRDEFVHQVSWGGNPSKGLVIEEDRVRLSPRKSFETWRSEILGRSVPWDESELAAALEIRLAVIETVLLASLMREKITGIELVRVQRAVEASSEAILISDEKGYPTFANRAFSELCGIPLEELPLRSVAAPVADPILSHEILQKTLGKRESWRGEVEIARPENGPISVALRIDPVHNEMGVFLGFIAIHFDLSERNRARKILEDHAERLEEARNEIEAQAKMLEVARTRAESANRAKSDFLANMCHEIRTPMNGVIGLSELLLDTDLNELQERYVRTIRASGDALMTVINDILDLSKIEAGKMTVFPIEFDLRAVLEELGILFEPRARQKGLRVTVHVSDDLPKVLIGDSIRIRQILTNLAGNAIKFTDRGEVSIEGSLVHGNAESVTVRIDVKDTGIGIPASIQHSIFESFTQGEVGNVRGSTGTGLGLTICRRLADLMGGEIVFQSVEGEGSQFALILKLDRPMLKPLSPSNPSPKTEPPAPPERRFRILVAEDNAVNQLVARGLISRMGHEVTIVQNGLEAIEALSTATYDLILMDVQMPVMDGYTATTEIRRIEAKQGRRTPIIALTAYALTDERENCFNSGMDDYLSKPISPVALQEMLDRFVRQSGNSIECIDKISNLVDTSERSTIPRKE
jgi:PAS domain S-box-containing protein